ncbi:MAG: Bro-N domain-containing protein [Bacteroidales bacterium]|nr:Bro-N domain-containing protein [Bacteroidales bacterium]
MTKKEALKLFEEKKVRTVWDDEKEKWYFSIVDVVAVLTDSPDAKRYWSVLKSRIKKEAGQGTTNCSTLKLQAADGKMRMTDVADTEQLFRLIQSIPSPKAEPFKQWMAQVASTRLDQLQDPELSIDQAVTDYKRLGYSDAWINQRIRSIEIRKELTDEWKRGGVRQQQYAALTDIITKEWSGITTKQYKHLKGLKKENLRDHMTNLELVLNSLAEASTTELSKNNNPKGMTAHTAVARKGAGVAKAAKENLEKQLGRSVVSPINAKELKKIGNTSPTNRS